jgi:hypothetical protein
LCSAFAISARAPLFYPLAADGLVERHIGAKAFDEHQALVGIEADLMGKAVSEEAGCSKKRRRA